MLPRPESTYRLQFHAGFTFRDAEAIVGYLNDLGVTHKVHVNRGFEPSTPGYGYYEVNLLSQVPPLLGI